MKMEENTVMSDILSKEESMGLNALKEAAGLSNKQWDKGLTKHGLAKVTKTDNGLIVFKSSK